MNTIRMIAIALPMVLLLACGGGGGSGTAVALTTPPTTTPPPTTGDPNMPRAVTLPGYAVTNLAEARTAVGGTEPTSMTEQQIISAIQTRATAADTFEFSDFSGTPDVAITCSNNSSCSGTVPDVGMLTFSLIGIEDLSLVDDTDLVGFISDSQAVMVDGGPPIAADGTFVLVGSQVEQVTMIQSIAAGRQSDGTQLAFQTYGGWLTNSVFGVGSMNVTEGATTTNRLSSFSFGENTGSNPTIMASDGGIDASWEGVVVGKNTENGNLVQGGARISIFSDNPNSITSVDFTEMKDLNTGNNVQDIIPNSWNNIPLNNGTFRVADGSLEGTFYGSGHTEVGGIFNHSNIIGAYGAARRINQ